MANYYKINNYCMHIGVLSSMYSVKSGVRKSGVCSGWLFNLYINELILKLEDSGLDVDYIWYICGLYLVCE